MYLDNKTHLHICVDAHIILQLVDPETMTKPNANRLNILTPAEITELYG